MRTLHYFNALILFSFLSCSVVCRGQVLWYNGDPSQRGALANQIDDPGGTGFQDARVFDDFQVTGSGWNVSDVWSIDEGDSGTLIPAQADWSIRANMSAGNGGTIIASGVSACTATVTGLPGADPVPIYKIDVGELNINLAPGLYWLQVTPVVDDGGWYIETTEGANAIGSPPGNDGNAFWDWPKPSGNGSDYQPLSQVLVGGDSAYFEKYYHDFSMGIGGVQSNAVPEPNPYAIFASLGLTGAALQMRRMNKPKRDIWNVRRDYVRAILERDFSFSLMNNTKWMEVLDILHEFRLRHRIKLIDMPSPSSWGILDGGKGSWIPQPFVEGCGYSPIKVVEIEWLEAETIERTGTDGAAKHIDQTQAVEERLQALNIPYTWQDGYIRITGHQRKT